MTMPTYVRTDSMLATMYLDLGLKLDQPDRSRAHILQPGDHGIYPDFRG